LVERPKVLVVDDDKNILSAFENFLSKENCSFIPVSCIDEAMVTVLLQPIDLLIMDVTLKKQLTETLLKYIKEIQRDLHIIIITGYSDIINEKDAKDYGADYFFLKPLELNKLRRAVRKCLHLDKIF
jgi:DNA-binding NtrC family response regulator